MKTQISRTFISSTFFLKIDWQLMQDVHSIYTIQSQEGKRKIRGSDRATLKSIPSSFMRVLKPECDTWS